MHKHTNSFGASFARVDCEKFNLVSWKFNLTYKMKSSRWI